MQIIFEDYNRVSSRTKIYVKKKVIIEHTYNVTTIRKEDDTLVLFVVKYANVYNKGNDYSVTLKLSYTFLCAGYF